MDQNYMSNLNNYLYFDIISDINFYLAAV